MTLFHIRQEQPEFGQHTPLLEVNRRGVTKNVGKEIITNLFSEESSSSIVRLYLISLVLYLCIEAESLRKKRMLVILCLTREA